MPDPAPHGAARGRALLLSATVVSALLMLLPLGGLYRVHLATNRSHDYVMFVAHIDALTNDVIKLSDEVIERAGEATSDDLLRALRINEAHIVANIRAIEIQRDFAEELALWPAVSAYAASVQLYVEDANEFAQLVSAGEDPAEARRASGVAISEVLAERGLLGASLSPTRSGLNDERRDTVRDAGVLVGVAFVLALAAVASAVAVDRRELGERTSAETARRSEAEALASQRSDLVNMASHELRNPLTVLTLTTDLLGRSARATGNAELAALADDARVASLRCTVLVDELLDLGRLEADRLQFKMVPTPLDVAIQEAVDMTQAHHGPRTIETEGQLALTVNADSARLRIILRNVIDNAFKYSPAGAPVRIQVSSSEGRASVRIADEGRGIPESDRERVFSRFERLPESANINGVGVGLFLSRELARRMDGDLAVVPSTKGSTFELKLRVAT